MSFKNWLNRQQQSQDSPIEASEQSPLAQPTRVDGATVNSDFKAAIKQAGGSASAYPFAMGAETQELFDLTTDQLYKQTGGRKGDRSTLPHEAQKAFIATEILATHRINENASTYPDPEHDQEGTDNAIVNDVRHTAKAVRKRLPW